MDDITSSGQVDQNCDGSVDSISKNPNENRPSHEGLDIEVMLRNIAKCNQAMIEICEADKFLLENYVQSANNPLLNLEDMLLSLSMSSLIDGIFYASAIKYSIDGKEKHLLSYFENGSFEKFFKSVFYNEIKNQFSDSIIKCVYNKKDIEIATERHHNMFITKRKVNASKNYHPFFRNVYDNKNSINKSIQKLVQDSKENNLQLKMLLCFVLTKSQKWEENVDKFGRSRQRFFFSTSEKKDWEERLISYRANPMTGIPTVLIFDNNQTEFSLEQQFEILNQLPNLHKYPWKGSSKVNVFLEQRFSACSRRYPGSPRNRIIQATFRDESYLIQSDCLNVVFCGKDINVRYPVKRVGGGLKRKRKNENCVLSYEQPDNEPPNVDASLELDENVEEIQNDIESPNEPDEYIDLIVSDKENEVEEVMQGDSDRHVEPVIEQHSLTLYDYYVCELFRKGQLAWRILTPHCHAVVMNGYHRESGNFLENDFVLVTGTLLNNGFHVKCSCATFSVNLSSPSTCCHSRLLRYILDNDENHRSKFVNSSKIEQAKLLCRVDVIQLPSKGGVDRFSVKTETDVQFVTLFNISKTKRNIVKCHSSICKMSEGSCRNVNSISNNNMLCSHLKKFRSFYLSHVFADSLDVPPELVVDEYFDELDFEEYDDATPLVLPEEKWRDVFDPITGLWHFDGQSPSKETVDSDSLSEKLKENIKKRMNGRNVFSPDIPTANCDCDSHWVEADIDGVLQENLVFERRTNLYTDREIIECDIYSRKCMANNCVICWDGAEDSIFCLSRETCAGYEIGWSFVHSVMSSKNTFSGFVSFMDNQYKLYGNSSFMSVQTFIRWFFAWASRMRVDFREKCYGCRENPSIVACDGTKIGISFKETFVTPIEHAQKNSPSHHSIRRLDRCFIKTTSTNPEIRKQYSHARIFLKHLTDTIIQGKSITDTENVENLKPFIPPTCVPSFEKMISSDEATRKSYAKVFKLLSYDSSVDAILPYAAITSLDYLLVTPNQCSNEIATLLHAYCPELSALVSKTCKTELSEDIYQLLCALTNFVKGIHENNIKPDPPNPIPESYNPPKYGRAYYFTEHGSQLREIRRFPIDADKKNNFDDMPEVACAKNFPVVSKRGSSYLFLWFCPMHGHCYGFHIIPGSEGRKDAAASLYMYMEKPPEAVFYDFACSLSEYTHNRESGFFAETRFYHDIFHGYTHKCTPAFRCDRISAFENVNTQICEQFNSFLQNIKASGRLMSQLHFTFYVQFMINQWNKTKRESHKKLENIALLSKE